jgi:hypothetical protein
MDVSACIRSLPHCHLGHLCAAVDQATDTATRHVRPPHDLDRGGPCTMDWSESNVSVSSSSSRSSMGRQAGVLLRRCRLDFQRVLYVPALAEKAGVLQANVINAYPVHACHCRLNWYVENNNTVTWPFDLAADQLKQRLARPAPATPFGPGNLPTRALGRSKPLGPGQCQKPHHMCC